VDDWIGAALDIMVEEGVSGVKIHRLCERLGVTKGSFYWHFTDLDTFLEEVARRWSHDGSVLPPGVKLGPRGDPYGDLMSVMQAYVHPRNRDLSRAVRDWSDRDDRARLSMAAVDQTVLQLLQGAFTELGFGPEDSALRAKVLYYVGVGFGHVGLLGDGGGAVEQVEAVLAILTRTT
jgi:AcrR family transcriptional regulator